MLTEAAGLATGLLAGWLLLSGSRHHRRRRAGALAELVAESGVGLGLVSVQWLRAAGTAATFALTWGLTGSPVIALPPAVAAWRLPLTLLLRRRIQRRRRLQESWPDGLRELSASISAGLSLPQAVAALATSGPEDIRATFARVPALLPALGFRRTLEAVREQAADPTTDRVIEVLLLAHERGGRVLPELLADLAEDAARELQLVERVATAQLELRINARAVFVIPWLVLCVLTVRPGPFREFYASPGGAAVVLVAAVLSAVGVALVERLGRVPLEPRVLGTQESQS